MSYRLNFIQSLIVYIEIIKQTNDKKENKIRDFIKEVVLPIMAVIFCVMLFILVADRIGVSLRAFVESRECKIWSGEYHMSTGCLMKVDGIMVTLEDYKAINRASIEKPIETNANIRIKGE